MEFDLYAVHAVSTPTLNRAAELFGVLSAPVRLRIISELCREGEQSVTHLLGRVPVSQPGMSRHLSVLYRAGVLVKRRKGQQVFYGIAESSVLLVCKAVCSHVVDGDESAGDLQAHG